MLDAMTAKLPEWEITRGALVDLDLSLVAVTALFLLLFYILNRTFLQPMLKVFDERHALTDGAREEAGKAVQSAEERIERCQWEVGKAGRKAVAEQKRLRSEGLARERDVLDRVKKESDEQVSAGVASLQEQAAQAENELQKKAETLAAQITSRVVGRAS